MVDHIEQQLRLTYDEYPKPTVTSVVPNRGVASGGTPIQINGSGFLIDAPDSVSATIDGNTVILDPVTSDVKLTGITPSGDPGDQDVIVTAVYNGEGTSGVGIGLFTYFSDVQQRIVKKFVLLPQTANRISLKDIIASVETVASMGNVGIDGVVKFIEIPQSVKFIGIEQ